MKQVEEHDLDINETEFYSPLDKAIYHGNLPVAKWLVQQDNIIVEGKNRKGKTVLHTLIWFCDDGPVALELMDLILKKGLSIESTDKYNDTPLHYAVKKHSFEITKYLLHHQANPNALNGKNEVPLHFCYKSYFYNSIKEIKKNIRFVDKNMVFEETLRKFSELHKSILFPITRFNVTMKFEDSYLLTKNNNLKKRNEQYEDMIQVLHKLELRHQAILCSKQKLQKLFDKYAMMIILFLDNVENQLNSNTCQAISQFCFSAMKFGVNMDILRDKYIELNQEEVFNDIIRECEESDISFDILWNSTNVPN